MAKRENTYSIETMADAAFVLKYSADPEHQLMARHPHDYGIEKMLRTARGVAAANIEAAAAAKAA